MELRVHIDRSACRGSGACVRRAPSTFSLDADRRAVATDPPRDPEAVLREVAHACPFFAIAVEELGD